MMNEPKCPIPVIPLLENPSHFRDPVSNPDRLVGRGGDFGADCLPVRSEDAHVSEGTADVDSKAEFVGRCHDLNQFDSRCLDDVVNVGS